MHEVQTAVVCISFVSRCRDYSNTFVSETECQCVNRLLGMVPGLSCLPVNTGELVSKNAN